MLQACCVPELSVTETSDNVVITANGVSTIIPKFKGCNDEPLRGGDQLVACDELPEDVNVQNFTYATGTRVLTITETDGETHTATLPKATTSVAGLVELATEDDYPDHNNDVDAATPAYVKAAIDAIPAIPLDTSATVLADVIAAPDGLSGGQWRKPNSRAATAAELNAVGASRVEVPVTAMDALWGNRAQEPADTKGVMNEDGSLGYGSRYMPGSGEAAAQTAIDTAMDNNGAYLFLSDLTTGDALTVPAPRYAGQRMTIRVAANSPTDEIVVNFAPVAILGGVYRRVDHKIERGATGFNRVLMRDGETLSLVARSPAAGWDVESHNYRLLSGFGWQERESGLVALDFEVSGTTTFANGNILTEDFALPVALANPVNFRPVVGDINMTGVGLGDVPFLGGKFEFRPEPDGNTATTFRLSAINTGTTPAALGRIRVQGESARLDYAALGGVA